MSAGRLWEFANRLYAAPGASDACLLLQDDSGVDVCVLMLLLWLGRGRQAVRATQVHMILRSSESWRGKVVQPLRIIRRELKRAPALLETAGCERLRTAIEKAELRAEQLQLDALEMTFGDWRLCDRADSVGSAARASLESYQSALSRTFSPAAVKTLIIATESLDE